MVTHDRDEAFVLGDSVALMRDGRILAHGPPEELYSRPVDEWAAQFLGEVVILDATAQGSRADTVLGPLTLLADSQGPVRVPLRPEQVSLTPADPSAGASQGSSIVRDVQYHGPRTTYLVCCAGLTVLAEMPGPPRFRSGDEVVVELPTSPLCAFEPL